MSQVFFFLFPPIVYCPYLYCGGCDGFPRPKPPLWNNKKNISLFNTLSINTIEKLNNFQHLHFILKTIFSWMHFAACFMCQVFAIDKYQWSKGLIMLVLFVCLMVLNGTFNNISVMSWRPVLLVEENGGPRENHQPVTNHWQTLSHKVVRLALIEICTHNISDDRHWLRR